MSVPIKVVLGEIDPPSLIMDVVNLPDPVYVGFTARMFNYDDVGLYFQMTGSGTGWTFSTVNHGLVASGGNIYRNMDNFCNKARPASETSEQIQLILKAYTDSGYSNLKWTYTKTLDVWWIKSDDGSWTTDFLNNFDDGTVQGWAVANEAGNIGGYPQIAAVTDFVLSPPYSVRMTEAGSPEVRCRLYKSFATPSKNYVLAIMDIRASRSETSYTYPKYIRISINGTSVLFIGRPYDTAATIYIPLDKWMRVIVPLPAGSTIEIRVILDTHITSYNPAHYIHMDDFRIISKD